MNQETKPLSAADEFLDLRRSTVRFQTLEAQFSRFLGPYTKRLQHAIGQQNRSMTNAANFKGKLFRFFASMWHTYVSTNNVSVCPSFNACFPTVSLQVSNNFSIAVPFLTPTI